MRGCHRKTNFNLDLPIKLCADLTERRYFDWNWNLLGPKKLSTDFLQNLIDFASDQNIQACRISWESVNNFLRYIIMRLLEGCFFLLLRSVFAKLVVAIQLLKVTGNIIINDIVYSQIVSILFFSTMRANFSLVLGYRSSILILLFRSLVWVKM